MQNKVFTESEIHDALLKAEQHREDNSPLYQAIMKGMEAPERPSVSRKGLYPGEPRNE